MATVIHVTTVHPRRDVRIWVKECRSLAGNEGRNVVLAVADSLGDEQIEGVQVLDLGRLPVGRPGRMLMGSWRVFRCIRRLGADLVHVHDPELLPVCLVLRLRGHKVIYDAHEDMPRQILAKHWLPRFLRQPVASAIAIIEQLASAGLNGIVAATPSIARRFPAAKTVLIRNFPIIDEFANSISRPQQEREAAFAYIGAIADIRGAKEMVAAVAEFPAETQVRLKFAGNYSPPELRGELERMPGWKSVDSLGWLARQDVVDLLGRVRAGLVVLQPTPNYVEALPVKLFEYLAAGIPVVASDFPIWRQIVGEAACGLLVDPTNSKSIADAMRWILDHPDEADEMGRRGHELIARRCNWSTEFRRLDAFYEALGV